MKVPPGVSAADFSAALAAFEQVVGKDWVFTSDEDVALYRDAYSPLTGAPDEHLASAAVAPASTEEVQGIVRIANQYRIPIYPISTGRDLGYGGAAPVLSGSVVVDLKRMNRVLEVNEKNASALVEPGVSYFDLYNYIQERGLKVWIDCPDPGWGSPVGNSLDRGGGYTMAQFRNHFDAHCGLEVVLPNGEIMRTGMGAIPGAETWQQYKTGCGPWVDGIFSQGNYGIVTKMGLWLMPKPDAFLRGVVSVPRYADLHPLVDELNYLENMRIMTGMPDLSSPLLGAPPLMDWPRFFEGKVTYPMGDEQRALVEAAEVGYSPALEAYALAHDIPYWECSLGFYGPMEVIDAQWKAAQARFAGIKGVKFRIKNRTTLPVSAEHQSDYEEAELGVPSLRAFSMVSRSKVDPVDHHGHVGFSPIIPRTAAAIFEINRVFSKVTKELDLPLFRAFTLPTCYWERAFCVILAVPLSEDLATNQRYIEGFKALIKLGGEHGWGEYRTPPVLQPTVIDVYSFNNHVLHRFHETLKDAIDPNGIISAGRYDIWPKYLREQNQ